MYEVNRSYRSALYTDQMIYSPCVPVFRDETSRLLEKPLFVSIITAPAVHAGVVKSREPANISRIQSTMETRIGMILALALINGHDALVLGAYGCGVFKNDRHAVARSFAHHLGPEGHFAGVFPCVTFAIPGGNSANPNIYPFKKYFGS